jgi:hypothetical protein
MDRFPDQTLGVVGQCIYCGTKAGPLTDEHIVPFGLNGPWVLRQASCQECANITSRFEMDVQRRALIAARTALGLPTRHRGQRPDRFRAHIEREGEREYLDVSINEYPLLMALPYFSKPAYLDQRQYEKGIDLRGVWSHANEAALRGARKLALAHDTDAIYSTINYEPAAFARMIAKIAFGFTVVAVGCDLSQIQEAYVLPAILGQTNDIGRWVGCADEKNLTPGEDLHKIQMAVDNGEVTMSVRLFAELNAPEYLVVVGRISKNSLAEVMVDYQPKGVTSITW